MRKIEGGVVKWNLTIPAPLAAEFERLNWDPVREQPAFGSKADFVRRALQDFCFNQMKSLGIRGEELLTQLQETKDDPQS